MISTLPIDLPRRKRLAAAITSVLTPAQLTMAHSLLVAEKPGRPAPQPEELLYWIRLNMPVAAQRIETVLHPAD